MRNPPFEFGAFPPALMEDPALEDLSSHIAGKISSLRRLLELRRVGADALRAAASEVGALRRLLSDAEAEVRRRQEESGALQAVRMRAEAALREAELLHEHFRPPPVAGTGAPRRGTGSGVKEAEPISEEELRGVPAYLKGRLTLEQINSALRDINTAMAAKYRPSSSSSSSRARHHRFPAEETDATKGLPFVVDADLEAFARRRVDRRFRAVVAVLRHCRRVREVRGAGLLRYVVC